MKRIIEMLKYYVFAVVFVFMGLQTANARTSLGSELNYGLSLNNNRGYKWICRFAHPTNSFKSGSCEVVGNNIVITICSKSHTTKIGVRNNGVAFDDIWVVDDDDTPVAFEAADNLIYVVRNGVKYLWQWLRKDQISRIEEMFMTGLDNINAKQACLAMINHFWWNRPEQNALRSVLEATGKYEVACQRLLTDADVVGMSKLELTAMFNWILARNGYIFDTQSEKEYFSGQSWYEGVYTDFRDVYYMLSVVELANLEFISTH